MGTTRHTWFRRTFSEYKTYSGLKALEVILKNLGFVCTGTQFYHCLFCLCRMFLPVYWCLLVFLPFCSGNDVIVVGAGISGISAARKLVHTGGYDVTVLEARGRVGGRIWTDKSGLPNATGTKHTSKSQDLQLMRNVLIPSADKRSKGSYIAHPSSFSNQSTSISSKLGNQ